MLEQELIWRDDGYRTSSRDRLPRMLILEMGCVGRIGPSRFGRYELGFFGGMFGDGSTTGVSA
jgi:hypothetical protein